MDNFTYNYLNIGSNPSNRLGHVSDAVNASANTDDIESQSANNYDYDQLGQLIGDQQEQIANIEWRSGDKKIKTLTRTSNSGNKSDMEFVYNPMGQRILKIEKPRVNNVLQTRNWWRYTYYTYDANGQVMATYEVTLSTALNRAYLKDQNIYGASRIGMRQKYIALYENATVPYTIPAVQQNTLGTIAYEITNYLGNVNVVISDRKIWNATPTNAFKACIVSRTDYFPFGMEISCRTTNSDNYRFGYNGMESDNETKGSGNSYTTEFRQYDPRIGRWLSLDPLMAQYPMMSPYVAFNNNPIYFVDPLGLEGESPGEPEIGYKCTDESGTERIYEGDGNWGDTENKKIIEVSIKHGLGNGGEVKSLGGKFGGHVGVTFGDETIGFSNSKHGGKLFGRIKQVNRDGFFASQPKWDAEAGRNVNVAITTFKIPVSDEIYYKILNDYLTFIQGTSSMVGVETRRKEGQPKSYFTPYDYGFFNGKRCASSAFDMLLKNCVIPDVGYLRLLIEINPGNVYRYLMLLASVNSWGVETSYDEQMKFQPYEGKSVEKFLGKTKKYNSYKKNIVDKLIRRWYAKKEDE